VTETERIARAMVDRSLPKAHWTHEAHLRVGLWHALHHPDETALTLVRDRIRAYNEATGVANTATSGYHETITCFYMKLIRGFLNSVDSRIPVDLLAARLIAEWGAHDLPMRHYSRDRLFSPQARFTWVPPDLQPLEYLLCVFDPRNPAAHNELGRALSDLKRHEAAVASYEAAIALNPGFSVGYYNRALALHDMGRYEAAVASFDQAIVLNPAYARAHNYRGNALCELGRLEAALAGYDAAISLSMGYADAHNNRGNALLQLERYAAALASFDAVVALQPRFADAHNNRGNALYGLGRPDEALAAYDRAIALEPDHAGFHFNRGQVQDHLRQHAAAAASYGRVLELKPDFNYAFGHRLLARMQSCDWRGYEADLAELTARIERGEPAASPFAMLALSDSAALQKTAAQIWIRNKAPPDAALGAIPRSSRGGKIRIGYFSADFCDHPVSYLTAELFEIHDRSAFEVYAFSFGPDTQDGMRKRLERAFDRFLDVRDKPAAGIAAMARAQALDIAVDLTGLTTGCRPKIFALRAAPVQAVYLGFLGTMGAPYFDYLIADTEAVPLSERRHFVEKLAYLPSYQANDTQRSIAGRTFSRQELGLPEAGFVFGCFNAGYKLTPPTFDLWMRILARVPGAVLFLYAANGVVAGNLRLEARARGLDARRLVFGGPLPAPEYLARYRSVDLFLDTLPYNAGTTASDALWAGLPVLTCAGHSFAGRVAASLLRAVHMPELIASTAAQYEDLAVALAGDPARMTQLKRTLAEHRLGLPLFDSRLHTRNLEAAYTQMHARHQAGLPPADIFV
jgi:protein O-GlcNAc transferase